MSLQSACMYNLTLVVCTRVPRRYILSIVRLADASQSTTYWLVMMLIEESTSKKLTTLHSISLLRE